MTHQQIPHHPPVQLLTPPGKPQIITPKNPDVIKCKPQTDKTGTKGPKGNKTVFDDFFNPDGTPKDPDEFPDDMDGMTFG